MTDQSVCLRGKAYGAAPYRLQHALEVELGALELGGRMSGLDS